MKNILSWETYAFFDNSDIKNLVRVKVLKEIEIKDVPNDGFYVVLKLDGYPDLPLPHIIFTKNPNPKSRPKSPKYNIYSTLSDAQQVLLPIKRDIENFNNACGNTVIDFNPVARDVRPDSQHILGPIQVFPNEESFKKQNVYINNGLLIIHFICSSIFKYNRDHIKKKFYYF